MMALQTGMEALLVQMGGLATAVLLLRGVRTRSRLVACRLAAGFAYAR